MPRGSVVIDGSIEASRGPFTAGISGNFTVIPAVGSDVAIRGPLLSSDN